MAKIDSIFLTYDEIVNDFGGYGARGGRGGHGGRRDGIPLESGECPKVLNGDWQCVKPSIENTMYL
ncbi:37867_t:CDS:2, partial [Gigaspora margarita]